LSGGNWKELYQAAVEGNLELVEYHVREGVNLNYQHPEILSTPLVAAILSGQTTVALYLLKNGADPKLESYFESLTPLAAAKKVKNKDIIEAIKTLSTS
jgi:ankyrin repeat protein